MFNYIPERFAPETADTVEEGERAGSKATRTRAARPSCSPATRSRASITAEVKAGRGSPHGGVFLDIASRRPAEFIKRKLPSMYHQFKELAEVDITKEPMEVGPTLHYFMGGVQRRCRLADDDGARPVRVRRVRRRHARRESARRQLAVRSDRVRQARRRRRGELHRRDWRRRRRRTDDQIAGGGAARDRDLEARRPARTRTSCTRSCTRRCGQASASCASKTSSRRRRASSGRSRTKPRR